MKKFFTLIILIFAAIFLSPRLMWLSQDAYASEIYSESSAKLVNQILIEKDYALDTRTKAVRNVFKKYNSPLIDQAAFFVKYADKYRVDWRLLPAISGLESSFGVYLMPGSYNAYGWGRGYIYFKSWENGIETINKALRENYIEKGAESVWTIGPTYAESKTWAVRVFGFMEEIEKEYTSLAYLSVTSNL